jgi:hypothetical protein
LAPHLFEQGAVRPLRTAIDREDYVWKTHFHRVDRRSLCLLGRRIAQSTAGRTTPVCGSDPIHHHQSADVVGKVLQADFGFRPRDADRRTIRPPGEFC